MVKEKIVCEECENSFTLSYDEESCEGKPTFCPWCCSYIDTDENQDDDQEYSDE